MFVSICISFINQYEIWNIKPPCISRSIMWQNILLFLKCLLNYLIVHTVIIMIITHYKYNINERLGRPVSVRAGV